jgi:hypothetical protein
VPGPGFALSKLAAAIFPDPDLRLALGMAEKLARAREEAKPLILFVDHSGQVSLLLPFRIYGNFLFFEFNGEKYVTYYDAQKVYRIKGLPVVHCLENQLYPVELRDAAVLSYLEPLRDMLLGGLEALRSEIERKHPEYVEDLRKRVAQAEQGQADPPDPVLSENPLLQIEGIKALLRGHSVRDVLKGVELAFAALGIEPAFPIDVRVVAKYVPRKTTLKELLTYYERWAYAHFAALSGLQQFYGKRLDVNKMLQMLILVALLLLGAYFFLTYVLPGFVHAAAPAPPAGVKVP